MRSLKELQIGLRLPLSFHISPRSVAAVELSSSRIASVFGFTFASSQSFAALTKMRQV